MSLKTNFDGLNKLKEKVEKLGNTTEVSLGTLLNDKFMSSNSKFGSLDELCKASGFKIESKEDFLAIPDDEWNKFISENTSFESWEAMQKSAFAEYVKGQLSL